MTKVFQTREDSQDIVEIVGAGVIHPRAEGPGVVVEEAARVMVELQERDMRGWAKLDEAGAPVPLKGADLTAAAKEYAEARGLRVIDMSEAKRAEARQALGLVPEARPAGEVAEEEYQLQYAGLVHVNGDPTAQSLDGSVGGQPGPPASGVRAAVEEAGVDSKAELEEQQRAEAAAAEQAAQNDTDKGGERS